MNWTVLFSLLLIIMLTTSASRPETSVLDNFYNSFKDLITVILDRTRISGRSKSVIKKNKLQDPIPQETPFPCDIRGTRSDEPPDSVDKLRPGDIDVIGALGDSLTAANAGMADRFLEIGVENRGISATIGGQGSWREYLTLPNIIKVFNPNLIGYSLGDSWAYERNAQFNVAEPGAKSQDLSYMAKVLVKRIKADKRVNFQKDWKLITLFIAANDFCSEICYSPDPEGTSEVYRKELMETFDYLRENLPRTIVMVLLPPNVDVLASVPGPLSCYLTLATVCSCYVGSSRKNFRKRMHKITHKWQKVTEEVCRDPRYKKQDFTVVLQPFLYDAKYPKRPDGSTDPTFVSEDCLHFSQKGHGTLANALWNNMLEPVGAKSTNWTPIFERFLCPTPDSPYIYTYRNSGASRDLSRLKNT